MNLNKIRVCFVYLSSYNYLTWQKKNTSSLVVGKRDVHISWGLNPSAVAPCSVDVQYTEEVSPRLLIQPKLLPCTFLGQVC